MNEPYAVISCLPRELSAADFNRCVDIIGDGGAIDARYAQKGLRDAVVAVVARTGETIVAVGAIKGPNPPHARTVSTESGVLLDAAIREIGYIAVDPQHRRRGLSPLIVAALLTQHRGALFATTPNEWMKRVLRSAEFERRGRQWLGDSGRLSLWIRDDRWQSLAAARNLRGWLDYDRDKLSSLTPAERIDYFEWRVRRVGINPLERILANEISPTDSSSALLIFGVSLCCAIEATGHFLEATAGDPPHPLERFLKRYMHSEFQTRTVGQRTFASALRAHFRNGLAHGFAVKHGGFEGNPDEPYFKVRPICGTDSVEINPTAFFDDYAVAFEVFLTELRGVKPSHRMHRAFSEAFERVFMKGE